MIILVLPTLRRTGGTLEAINLLQRLPGTRVKKIVALWGTESPIDTNGIPSSVLFPNVTRKLVALLTLPALLTKLHHHLDAASEVVLTHYSTFIYSIFPSRKKNYYVFVQDAEWMFIANSIIRKIVRRFVESTVHSADRVIFTSPSLKKCFDRDAEGCFIWPIMPSAVALSSPLPFKERHFDIICIIRSGFHKDANAYLQFFDQSKHLKICVVSIEKEFAFLALQPNVSFFHNLSRPELFKFMSNSRVLVNFSSHEGFGLVPLEGLACGCALVCRDNFGARNYLPVDFPYLLEGDIINDASRRALDLIQSDFDVKSSIQMYIDYVRACISDEQTFFQSFK